MASLVCGSRPGAAVIHVGTWSRSSCHPEHFTHRPALAYFERTSDSEGGNAPCVRTNQGPGLRNALQERATAAREDGRTQRPTYA